MAKILMQTKPTWVKIYKSIPCPNYREISTKSAPSRRGLGWDAHLLDDIGI